GLRFGKSNTEAIKWANKVLGIEYKPKAKAIDLDRFERIPRSTSSSNLKGNEKVIFGNIIARCGNKAYCFVGRETIAEDCGVSIRSVARAIDTLESVGLLEQYSRGFNKPKYKVPVIKTALVINSLLDMNKVKDELTSKLGEQEVSNYYQLAVTSWNNWVYPSIKRRLKQTDSLGQGWHTHKDRAGTPIRTGLAH